MWDRGQSHVVRDIFKGPEEDLSGGPEVKNLPSSAGDTGSTSGWATTKSHAVGQLEKATCPAWLNQWINKPVNTETYFTRFFWKSALCTRKRESESRSVVPNSLRPHGLYSPWNSPCQNTGVGRLSLLQEIFPTQGLNPGLQCCRQTLYLPAWHHI